MIASFIAFFYTKDHGLPFKKNSGWRPPGASPYNAATGRRTRSDSDKSSYILFFLSPYVDKNGYLRLLNQHYRSQAATGIPSLIHFA